MLFERVLCVAVLVAAASGETFTWVATISDASSPQPPARHSAAMGSMGGTFYVFGGRGNMMNGTHVLGDVWSLTISGGTSRWSRETPVPSGPSGRYSMVYGVMMDKFLLVSHGRGQSDDNVYDDTWALDMGTLEWVLVNVSGSSEVPEGRYDAAGGVYGNLLWLSMGKNKDNRILSDTWVLHVNRTEDDELVGEWVNVHSGVGLNQYDPFLPHARYKHAGTPVSETQFVLFGGCASGGYVGGPCPLGDSWVLDSESEEWEKLPECSTPTTDSVMMMLSPNRGVLVMGDDDTGPGAYPQRLHGPDSNSSDVNQVDTENDTWTVHIGGGVAIPRKRTDPAIARGPGNQIILFGGRSIGDEEVVMSDVWRLTWMDGESDEKDCPGIYFSFVHLHGVLMYVAWGLLLPLGALLGRYYRFCWPVWFILHIIVQSLGVLLTVAGFVLIFLVGSYDEPNFPHAIVGIILTAMLLQQFLSGIFHPCVDRENGQTPKEEKSAYRRCWEVYHATSGFLSVALGIGQVTLGLFLVVPPLVVWAVWCGLGLAWVLTFVIHEVVYIIIKIRNRVKN